jgi:hypothetical protein
MTKRDYAIDFALGALGGVAMTLGAWFIVSRLLDKQIDNGLADFVSRGGTQLRHTLDTEIPRQVGAAIDQKFSEAGITRDTGRQLAMLLTTLEQRGVLSGLR